jgi:hypothetical protein
MANELETKSFGAFEIKDAEKGEVTAIVATLGVVDKDGDVLLPGSFPDTASVKLSAYGHDTILDGAPHVGRGTITTRGDKVVLDAKFFLSIPRGRDAFSLVKEDPQLEWSFGFPRAVKTAQMTDEWKAKGARRLVTGIQPIEASPVFVGAGVGTQTVSAKEAPVETVEDVQAKAAALIAANAEAERGALDRALNDAIALRQRRTGKR